MKRQYTIYNICVLFALLFLGGGWNMAWGQTTFPDVAIGQSEEIRYVIENSSYKLRLQEGGIRDNLNGYILWYQQSGDGELTSNNLTWNNNYKGWYWNGLYYDINVGAPAGEVSYTNDNIIDGRDVIVCEASSIKPTNNTPRQKTVERKYIIYNAEGRETELNKIRTNTNLASWIKNVGVSLDIKNLETFKKSFFEYYEIHTPMESGTSYRLAEVLNNYIVKDNSGSLQYPNKVRWRVYDSNGDLEKDGFYKRSLNSGKESQDTYVTDGYIVFTAGDNYNLPNIFSYYYPYDASKKDVQQVFYLTAEVSYNEDVWYPISFLTIYLEPYSEVMIKDELDKLDENSPLYTRTEKYLSEPAYIELERVDFDNQGNVGFPSNDKENYPLFDELSQILEANSYYAFAAPRYHQYRQSENRFVGRGEYGLYKTLGYDGISPQNIRVGDVYYANFGLETYKVKVTDRRHETNNDEYGYFFYVDASDEAGVITQVALGKDALCPNTRIIVTAWVCNLQSRAADQTGALNADIGLTFKGILNDLTTQEKKEETILYKFYSGEIKNNPLDSNDGETRANWQQVYFAFDFTGNIDYDEYVLEVANNCRHSNGADYAIDDIRIYRSLPDIEVRRQNACDASTLQINSDYETILRNMAWNEGQDVTGDSSFDELDYKKYRYGLMGGDGTVTRSTTGNVYFAFLERDRTYWINVDKEFGEGLQELTHALRIIVSTDLEKDGFPTSSEQALERERTLNMRAVNDYNRDIELWRTKEKNPNLQPIPTTDYDEAILELYKRLGIPRIRVPYYTKTAGGLTTIHLATIEVDNTDLKYEGQMDDEGNTASGEYRVIMFRAGDVAGKNDVQIDPDARCALISDFTVWSPTNIMIETEADAKTALCEGAIRKITATLEAYDENTGNPTTMPEGSYIFDWYLSTEDNYNDLAERYRFTVKEAINAYRDGNDGTTASFDKEDVRQWMENNPDNEDIQNKGLLLVELFGDEENGEESLLRLGTVAGEPFLLQIGKDGEIMAMPYLQPKEGYLYCTDETKVLLPISGNDSPVINPGFPTIQYVTDAEIALRLGHENMKGNKVELTIPVQDDFKMADGADYLGLATNSTAMWLNDAEKDYPEVGAVTALHIVKNQKNATVSFYLNEDAKDLLLEGGKYELLIPFVQYQGNTVLNSECDGLISLPIKVVPRYLTWTGKGSVWYNDENSWAISTKEELYNKSDVTNETKDVYSFSPLYFTKITVSDGKELSLYDESTQNSILKDTELNFNDMGIIKGTTTNIQYDMAVYSKDGGTTISVEPYYGNLVSEIYFKPEALLKNQQHLEYQKAWVEFEMEKNAKYWLASPLQDVFAGDMYAPKGTARQTTAAFTDIKYTDDTPGYDRWNPAFYQKAWDKGITYYDNPTTDGNYTAHPVSVVHSNWSIEYNNVDVPYALGKGFYASVEDFNNNAGENGEAVALVRLPKADDSYQYVTKAASTIANRPNSGELAKGDVTIILTDNDATNIWGEDQGDNHIYYADGDGEHFLIGNPYMYPLDIQKFFSGNLKEGTITNESIFEPKYWTLQDGTSTATVGTPDVGFGDNTGAISGELGQIAPMQAFFVELKDPLEEGKQIEVEFTTSMMAEQATTKSMDTKSFAATNPTLTITAERGETRSVAKLLTSDKAENGYRASEDAVVLLDSELDAPMVYTVAGSRAAQVNAVKKISNIGLGVYNAGDDEATLTISGISRMASPLYLYDAATRQSTRLEGDSYELRVSGDSHGRYFLRDAELGDELENTISVYSVRPGEVIVSSLRPVKDIRVFALNGSQVRRFSVNTTRYTFTLPAGIYMIQATDGERGQTEKVLVR